MPVNVDQEMLMLTSGWRLVVSEPSSAAAPNDVDWSNAHDDALMPGTVASTLLREHGPNALPDIDYDDFDWWYECTFDAQRTQGEPSFLVFEGLATIAEVWLNGEEIHRSRNMFRRFVIDVGDKLRDSNTLNIVFRSLNAELGKKRSRPRWKPGLVSHQRLRWIRTTLLGHMPIWNPGIQPVGPWRGIHLEQARPIRLAEAQIRAALEGNRGFVDVRAVVDVHDTGDPIDAVILTVSGKELPLGFDADGRRIRIGDSVSIDDVEPWSPGHYGQARLYDYSIALRCGRQDHPIKSGRFGFRSVEVDRCDSQLTFVVNGRRTFMRGSCWSTADIVSLDGESHELRTCLKAFTAAGGNMIRVGGTNVYESDAFYDLCDELGIAVWQDFMFANMDYPTADSEFLEDVTQEIEDQLQRLAVHPCVIAWCGNSEVEQQSAMFGRPESDWKNALFYNTIPAAVERSSPGAAYFPSSPCEGALPFHVAKGPSHYFGVGGYRAPLDSVRTAGVKFATECLAFSNVPTRQHLEKYFGDPTPAGDHPRWKPGIPQEARADFDSETLREHYMTELYGVDPSELRRSNPERYFAISEAVTGEVMEYVYKYWRSGESACSGALTWLLRDVAPGAGWGIFDSDGRKKSIYYFLRRAWSATWLDLVDRRFDGLSVIVANERDDSLTAELRVQLLRRQNQVIAEASQTVELAPGTNVDISVDAMLGQFCDSTYAFRFGALEHDVVVATLQADGTMEPMVSAYFPASRDLQLTQQDEPDIQVITGDGDSTVTVSSGCFLQSVKLSSETHEFSDNYFHVGPGVPRTVVATPVADRDSPDLPLRGTLAALNLPDPVAFE